MKKWIAFCSGRVFIIVIILMVLANGLVFVRPGWAGFIEIGGTGAYRKTTLSKTNFSENKAITASLAYYFMELSALELSYTNGLYSTKSTPSDPTLGQTVKADYDQVGLDFILSFAGRQSPIRPYIKVGGAYIRKRFLIQPYGYTAEEVTPDPSLVPSAGLGIKIRLSDHLSFKFALEGSSTPLPDKSSTFDYVGQAGVSWIF